MNQPVALFIFNRPEKTAKVLEQIRLVRPAQLFVIADGPRSNNKTDEELVAATRHLVDSTVDWPCSVYRNYSDRNLGCRLRPATGYEWVFQHVECCIFLEDDCLPHPSFFPYCSELLHRYAHDTRIFAVSGNNFLFNAPRRAPASYYFTKQFHAWGWATWKRAWDLYDINMTKWPLIRDCGFLLDIWRDKVIADHWYNAFDSTYRGLDAWDYQFAFACQINNGLCIAPSVNLVSNIGFGSDATHTKVPTIEASNPAEELLLPLHHPDFVIPDVQADRLEFCKLRNNQR